MDMKGLGNDLRFAMRSLLRRRGFSAVAVLTLALGIGAATAVFTLLDGVLIRPLPFDRPDQLLELAHEARDGQDQLPLSQGLYLLYRERARTLDDVAILRPATANLVVEGEPARLEGQVVTPSFFTVLATPAAQGRTFLPEEGRPGGSLVVILSDALWRERFGADPSLVGRTIDLNGERREVIGVMPARFGYPDREARFWLPLVIDEANAPLANFNGEGIARMAPGQTVEMVRAEVDGMLANLPALAPGDGAADFLMNVGIHSRILPLKESLVGDLTKTLWILFATVGIVLLIACANVANLLLVRAEGRQRELAVRLALGGGRMQVLRSSLGESLVLALAGGALGVGVAALALKLTSRLLPTELPRMAKVGIDLRVLAFTSAVTLGCALFFGCVPLLRSGAADLTGQLRDGGARGATSGRERHRLRDGLVVSQVSLALVLLIGAGLMLRSFVALRAVDPGFDVDGVLTARVSVPSTEISDPEAVVGFFRDLHQRLAALPGVTAVGFAEAVPLGGSGNGYSGIEVEDHPRGPDELPIFASWMRTGGDYFEAMGIRVLEGRALEPTDGAKGFRAVVVGRSFAQTWWPGTSPLGRRLRLGAPDEDWYQIVGVVEDVRQNDLQTLSKEAVYFPALMDAGGRMLPMRSPDVVVRTSGDPLGLVAGLRRSVHEINSRIPISNPRSMEAVFEGATARTSFTMALLGVAAGIALVLGLVGIYGVVSYVVSQRTSEFGIRMVLGASGSTIRGMVVRRGLVLGGLGVGIGLVAAVLLSHVMETLLYGVSAIDPITYLAVSGTLVGLTVLGSLLPALRAAGVDPSRALRSE